MLLLLVILPYPQHLLEFVLLQLLNLRQENALLRLVQGSLPEKVVHLVCLQLHVLVLQHELGRVLLLVQARVGELADPLLELRALHSLPVELVPRLLKLILRLLKLLLDPLILLLSLLQFSLKLAYLLRRVLQFEPLDLLEFLELPLQVLIFVAKSVSFFLRVEQQVFKVHDRFP